MIRLELGEPLRVALLELGGEVVERRGRGVDEGDALGDLEGRGHLGAGDAVVVLDRDQVEEADQLLAAARLLLGREGGRGEVVEEALGVAIAAGRRFGRRRQSGKRRELAVGLLAGRGSALLLVLGGEQAPVAGGRRGGLGDGGVEARSLSVLASSRYSTSRAW